MRAKIKEWDLNK